MRRLKQRKRLRGLRLRWKSRWKNKRNRRKVSVKRRRDKVLGEWLGVWEALEEEEQ